MGVDIPKKSSIINMGLDKRGREAVLGLCRTPWINHCLVGKSETLGQPIQPLDKSDKCAYYEGMETLLDAALAPILSIATLIAVCAIGHGVLFVCSRFWTAYKD